MYWNVGLVLKSRVILCHINVAMKNDAVTSIISMTNTAHLGI